MRLDSTCCKFVRATNTNEWMKTTSKILLLQRLLVLFLSIVVVLVLVVVHFFRLVRVLVIDAGVVVGLRDTYFSLAAKVLGLD